MIKLPIRQLVELIMRCGDIDSRYTAKDRMAEGAKAHRILQKRNHEIYEDYRSEVTLAGGYCCNGIDYMLEGRADGIFSCEGRTVIEEIKTTVLPLSLIGENFSIMHWAQAKCYAYIYAVQNDLPAVVVQLTYFNLETNETKQWHRIFETSELTEFIGSLIQQYSVWTSFSAEWAEIRNLSIKTLQFPFPDYRKGQRELAVQAYRAIAGQKNLFVQAPTGTGKTISLLFPAIKAMGEAKTAKIFYLTAKTITRQVAEEAFEKMHQGGLKMKTLTLTSKEKICFCEKPACHPEYCKYAKGHFDRINAATLDAIIHCDDLSRSIIEKYAQKHTVCPFELSLDLSLLADCVICDYNYVFDPRAHLRRFFADNNGDYVFLIDEAHNLVDRAREMFSAELGKTDFYQVKKAYKGRNIALDKILNRINKIMIDLRHQCGEQGYQMMAEMPANFLSFLQQYVGICELMLKENKSLGEDSIFLQLYFDVLGFTAITDLYDERYVTFVETWRDEVTLKLFCLDPSFLLGEALKRGSSAVMFSATLSPLEYFREVLGGSEADSILTLDSPFDHRKLCMLTADAVSTKYKEREQSVQQIIQLIRSFVTPKIGNYIVYFPSYQYMNDVFTGFASAYPDITAVVQEPSMAEEDRERFLLSFKVNPKKTYVAFCVLGGIFSEGIDLKGSRLIGAAIVSVGLPQLSVQQNIIRDYFDSKNGLGYEYAYMYPGMNKVMQAAGRVIRSETDVGTVLLIDKRYSQKKYVKLFPKHWMRRRNIKDSMSLKKTLESFWQTGWQ